MGRIERAYGEFGAVELDDVLMNDFLRNFARELTRRYVAEPSSREFATRISNLDLMHLWLSGPTTVARYWLGNTFDLLDAFRPAGKLHDQETDAAVHTKGALHDVASC